MIPVPLGYDWWVGHEAGLIAEALGQRAGGFSVSDVAHVAWRRLIERWEFGQILADIRRPGVGRWTDTEPPLPPRPRPTTYAQFVEVELPALARAYESGHGTPPAVSDLAHLAWRRLVEAQPFEAMLRVLDPDAPPAPTLPAVTPIRPEGPRAVRDERGPRLLVGLSRFYWLWRLHQGDEARVRMEMAEDAALGYGYARVFLQVQSIGSSTYWAGREVDPQWPDHESLVGRVCELARAHRLHLLVTLIGKGGPLQDSADERRRFVARMGQVLKEHVDVVVLAEMMNEPGMLIEITPDELFELEQVFRSECPGVLTGTGAVWSPEGATAFTVGGWNRTQGEVGIAHLDRDMSRGEGQDRPWRQPWDVGLTGKRWVDNEPIGPGTSAAAENRARVLRSHRTVALLSRAFATCFHARPGIRGDSPMADTPGYRECPAATRFLPGDIGNGLAVNANRNFPGRHWTLEPEFIRAESGRGAIRAYGVQHRDRQYTVLFGLVSPCELVAERNLVVDCFQQDLGAHLWTREVSAGERVTFTAEHPDYVLVSRLR